MPTYEYRCKDCGEHLEVVQSFKDDPLTECPQCQGPLRKVFGNVGIVLKGSGFYKTDSRTAGKSAGSSGSGSSGSAGSGSGSGSDATGSSGGSGEGSSSSSSSSSAPSAPASGSGSGSGSGDKKSAAS